MTQEMRVRGFLEWILPYLFLSPTDRVPPLRSVKTQDLGTPLPKSFLGLLNGYSSVSDFLRPHGL